MEVVHSFSLKTQSVDVISCSEHYVRVGVRYTPALCVAVMHLQGLLYTGPEFVMNVRLLPRHWLYNRLLAAISLPKNDWDFIASLKYEHNSHHHPSSIVGGGTKSMEFTLQDIPAIRSRKPSVFWLDAHPPFSCLHVN